MTIAEQITRAKTDYDEVYKAGKFAILNESKYMHPTVSGSGIAVNDVNAMEHNLDIKLLSDTITDFSSVKVSMYGKNLFPVTEEANYYGVTLSKFEDYYVLNGTAIQSGIFKTLIGYLPTGTYTISANNPVHNSNYATLVQVYSPDTGSEIFTRDNVEYGSGKGTLVGGTGYYARIRIQQGVTYNNFIIKPQLELLTNTTSYEPYKEPQTATANADGTVEGLISLSSNMTLISNTDGVIINCEYYRDIDSYIDNSTINIALTGGD